jgi:autotransporter-associated beta strand protein
MKPKPVLIFRVLTACLWLPAALHAGTVTWQAGGGTWQNATAGGFSSTYNNGDSVIFGDTGVGTVVLSGALTPVDLTFNNTTGTYQFNTGAGTIAATGNLSVSGGGTVQFGNMTNSGNLNALVTWAGATSVSGGSTLNLTRPGNFGDGTTSVSLDNGTLRLGSDNSATNTIANPFSIGSGGGTIVGVYAGNQSIFGMSGAFTSGTSAALNLQTSGNSGNLLNSGLLISNANNSGFTGKVVISSLSTPLPSGMTNFNSAGSLFTGASSVTVKNGGILGVEFAVSSANLSNVTTGAFGGIGARGANGSLASLSSVMNYVGVGGNLLLDNQPALNNNRLSDSAAIALNSNRFTIIGRNASTNATNEVVGSITLSGGSIINLDQTHVTNSGVDLTTTSLATPTKGNSLLIQTDSGNFGSGAGLSTIVVTGSGANKPTVTNGMISPGIQQYDGANTLGSFVTFSGNELVTATYTNYAGDWSSAASTDIVNLTATTTLTGSGDLNIHALRITTGSQNLGGRTIKLGSGGLILSSINSVNNGTLDFGSGPGFIGAYNAASQAYVTASIAGSGGITVLGSSQSLNLNTGTNSFTGGLIINGGSVGLSNNAANGNDVTVNAFGRLQAGVFSSVAHNPVIGGLSGTGRVTAWFQGGSGAQTINITPVVSTSHTFNGNFANGEAGRALNIDKQGDGTQIFGADSVGTHTGTTTVSSGKLVINGNFSTATGNVSVASGAILGGSGILGGTTSVTGALAPGNSIGTLTVGNDVTWNGASSAGSATDWQFELGLGNTADLLSITGSASEFLKNTALGSNFRFNFMGSTAAGIFTLVDWESAASLGGAVLGTNFGLSDFSYTNLGGGNSGTFSFNGSSLQFTVVPEPGAAMLGGIGLLVLLRRRHR